jgi:methyl-accepting chemotaxis protein
MIVLALTLLVKSILKSIRLLMGQAEKIAAGDFTERIVLEQKDEIGILVFTLNKSMDSLEELISNIIMASQNLVRAVEEIASGNENLSQRTSEQASSLEEIAATVEETNASTRQNAGNANEANTLAETSSRLAVDGGHIVENAVLSISEINKSSKKISEIINMINEIAFQTNLLALNAAVEAARAGDQGRGFAVVAGEVRNLAQRSAGAAKEIGSLIKDSIGKIDEGTDLVNKSGDALKEIIISAKQVKDIIAEIAASSDEQSRGIEQINTAVTEMDTMTQQNAALVEETAAASEEMSNQAQELLSMVQEFKIRENLTAGTGSSKRKEVHIKTLQTRESVKTPVKSEVKSEKKYNPEHDGYEKF